MDMAELLGGLLKNRAAKRSGGSGGGGGLGALLEGLLGGAKRPAVKEQTPVRRPAVVHESTRGHHHHRDVGAVARDAYERYENRGRGGVAQRSELDNEQARMLICAMVNAAKSDGQLDHKEQEAILAQLGDVTQAEVDFLKAEFAKPLDVRAFAWDVPLGQEEQVYGFSVMSIDLDRNKEATYLRDLAHGLRLRPEQCNGIHQQLGEPTIF